MTIITQPLDAAVAHDLSTITTWAAHELAARIASKRLTASVGYSNASCSRYVDVRDDDLDTCVRISDHEAMSYNRAGDWLIALVPRDKFVDSNDIVHITAIYSVTSYTFDEDGYSIDSSVRFTENMDETDAEFEGWLIDIDDLDIAIERVRTFVDRRHA